MNIRRGFASARRASQSSEVQLQSRNRDAAPKKNKEAHPCDIQGCLLQEDE
jgi:hypothetical protein